MLLEHLDEQLRLGLTTEVLALAERHFGEADRQPKEAVQIAVRACKAARVHSDWALVIHWAEAGLALRTRLVEAEGWLHLFLGVAHLYRSNLSRAAEAFDRFAQLAARSPKLRPIAPYGDFNRAILCRLRQDHAGEVRCLRRAAAGFTALGYVQEPLQCGLELAWAHLLQGEVDEASDVLQELEPDLLQARDRETAPDVLTVMALYKTLAGELPTAEMLCRNLLNKRDLPARLRAEVLWIQGCIARAGGDVALARQLGDQAYEFAVADYWPPQIERIEQLRTASVYN